jgi:hypothetical protein
MIELCIIQLLRNLKNNRRGGPILEEILLIGIAVVIFLLIMGLIFGLINWTEVNIKDIFGWG